MAKADLGEKRVCAECAAKFFDLKKRPVVCPKCEFSFDPDTMNRRGARKAAAEPKPKETATEETEAEEETDDNEDETEEIDQKELSLDDAAPMLVGTDDDGDASSDNASGSALPDGYSEEGVDDETDILNDDEDEDAKLVDEEELDTQD